MGLDKDAVHAVSELYAIKQTAERGPDGIAQYEYLKPYLLFIEADFANQTAIDLVVARAQAAASATPPTPAEQLEGNNVNGHQGTAPGDIPTNGTEEELDMTEVTFVASDKSDEEKWLEKAWKNPLVKWGAIGGVGLLIYRSYSR